MSLFQEEFAATSAAMRVRFGAGVRHAVGEEMERLGLGRALILTTPQQAVTGAEFAERLGALAVGVVSGAAMHTPVAVSEEATAKVAEAFAWLRMGRMLPRGMPCGIPASVLLPERCIPADATEASISRGAAIYAVVGAINLPIINRSVVWWNSLHQPASITTGGSAIAGELLWPLGLTLVGFSLLFGALVVMRMRAILADAKVEARMRRLAAG